ncbi:MAG: hypothetical protein ACTHPS_21500 [Streptosporangiaceae bacterium]
MRRVAVIVALGALLSMFGGVTAASPALADTGTRQLHLAVTSLDFTSVTCVDPSDPSCTVVRATIVADASSNLSTGKGTFQATITVDNSPGGTCNIVDEPGAFIFDNGTIFTHSHHEDCAIHGLRIDTTFQVTGGTGDFAGATGGGHEFSAASASPVSPVIFNGTITF